MMTTLAIDSKMFWKMYTALRDSENVLWETDGLVTDENVNDQINSTYRDVSNVLNDLQPLITILKPEKAL
jgi:hypothetical protein